MSAPLPARMPDPEWRDCGVTSEVASASFDEDAAGLGTSPYGGDMARTGVRVPTAPTIASGAPTPQLNRYLIRLCGISVPSGSAILIKGLRQLATIRVETDLNNEPLVLEREIVSPFWSFPDGNISWHLRFQPNGFAERRVDAPPPGASPDLNALSPALVYRPPFAPYRAPFLGRAPGVDIGNLGTFRDIRFPWIDVSQTMNEVIYGGGNVVFYASVHQPDPSLRGLFPDGPGLRPEDLFVADFPQLAIYGRVAGAIIYELVPCCDELRKAGRRAP